MRELLQDINQAIDELSASLYDREARNRAWAKIEVCQSKARRILAASSAPAQGCARKPIAWRWRTRPEFSESAEDQIWLTASTEPKFINPHHHEVEPLYARESAENAAASDPIKRKQVEAICRAICKVECVDPDSDEYGGNSDPFWVRYANAVDEALCSSTPAGSAQKEETFSEIIEKHVIPAVAGLLRPQPGSSEERRPQDWIAQALDGFFAEFDIAGAAKGALIGKLTLACVGIQGEVEIEPFTQLFSSAVREGEQP